MMHCNLDELKQAIRVIESAVGNRATEGLPEDVFLLLTKLTPMVNVDLLITDPALGVLLTWRDDDLDGPGWHVPGGIIRYKETAAARVIKTAKRELGADVLFDPTPVVIREHIHPTQMARGHFISLLYRCRLKTPPDEARKASDGLRIAGQWRWHPAWPHDIIEVHRGYAEFFEKVQ
jgi:colanic acid biosynthesis protein WcaH